MAAWKDYGIAVAAVAVCTIFCFAIYPFLALTNLVMVYLLGTLWVATRGRRGPAILASAASVLCFDFFFVPPRWSFRVYDAQFIPTFIIMFVISAIISDLAVRIRAEAESAKIGETRTAALQSLSQRLAGARGLQSTLETAVRYIEKAFKSDVIALIPSGNGHGLEIKASGGKRDLDEKERSVAQWVFEFGRPAGLGTQTLPVVEALYLPLIGSESPAGVLRVKPRNGAEPLTAEQMLLLESFGHQIGLTLEVDRLQEKAEQTQLDMERERLRSSLLSSVSHDLRTPLAAIIGSASSLLQSSSLPADKKARDLLENIQTEGERLSRLVHNLIETTRLESGAVRLRKEAYSLEELIGSALGRLEKLLGGRKVAVDLPEDLPLVPLDSVLMEQVFINLLENAARHTPSDSKVEISARATKGWIQVQVADTGLGLAADELEKVFEKFYHARKSSAAGVGLGLAICRAVVNAHGGRIWAENRPSGGAVFRFTLPLA